MFKKIFSIFVAALACSATTLFATAPESMPTAPTVPANQVKAVYSAVYSADCNFADWGSGTTYAQEDYGKKFTTTSLGYFGLVDFALNCSKMEALHLDVWFTEAGSFRVVPIHGGAEQGVTVTVAEGEVNTWKSVDLALNEGAFASVTDWTNVYQVKIDNVPSQTFWLNNIYFYTSQAPAPYLFVGGIVTINELKEGETIYFQYFNYDNGKRVNGIAGDTNRNKSFQPYTTEGYCEISYTNMDDVERKYITNPVIVGNVDSIFQGEVYLFVDTLLTTAGTYNRMIGDSTATLTLSVKQNAPVVGDQFEDATSGLKFAVTSLDPKAVKVIANNYTGTSYTVPDTVKYLDVDFAVTEIEGNAFYNRSSLQSVTLPEGLLTIGGSAFEGCSSLESVTIPASVTTIEEFAFAGSGLQTITIPAGVTEIGEGAFCDCTGLTSVTFLGNACQDAIGYLAFFEVGKDAPALLTLHGTWAKENQPDEDGNWYGGKFELSSDPTALPTLFGDGVKGNKFLHNGQVIIRKDNKTYNALGQEVK